jgi:hypothetical protein
MWDDEMNPILAFQANNSPSETTTSHFARVLSNLTSLGLEPEALGPGRGERLQASLWYEDVYRYLKGNGVDNSLNRHKKLRVRCQATQYKLIGDDLYKKTRNGWRKCLLPDEVREVLEKAHDKSGHFGPFITMRHLTKSVWWPNLSMDVVDYVAGCVPCIQHSPSKPKVPFRSTAAWSPLHMVGMDHVGPLPTSKTGNRFIVTFVDYLSRFAWAVPVKDTSTAEAKRALELWRKWIGTSPLCLYLDPGSSFISEAFERFYEECSVARFSAPAKSHSSVGKIEVVNRILQQVLNKSVRSPDTWDVILAEVMRSINGRCI